MWSKTRLLWIGLALLALHASAVSMQRPLNPPTSLIEELNGPALVAPLIEQNGASDNPEDAEERAEQLKKIAEIFSKEPPSARGGSDGEDSKDVLGLDSDPLDIIGLPADKPDPSDLADQVATLQAEVSRMENSTKELPTKTAELNALKTQLSKAQADEAKAEASAEAAEKAKGSAAQASMKANQEKQLSESITQLEKQLSSLKAEQADLKKGGSGGAPSSAAAR